MRVLLFLLLMLSLTGCAGGASGARGTIVGTTLRGGTELAPLAAAEPLVGARNEWLSTIVRLTGWQGGRNARLRVRGEGTGFKPILSAMQVIAMPVDQTGAGYVRQTGAASAARVVPRALLPIGADGRGDFDLSSLRDPNAGLGGVGPRADGRVAVDVWIDLLVPAETPAGEYRLVIELLPNGKGKPVATMSVPVAVRDFVLPDDRHLTLAGRLDWGQLTAHFPKAFEGVTPRLMNRSDARYAPAVKVLDGLIALAQSHRASAFVPQLQPTVKWPSGEPPTIDWADYDALVQPWLSGDAFADRTPLAYWPLPAAAQLDQFDPARQRTYWGLAASHFDQRDWLERSGILLRHDSTTRSSASASIRLSTEAAAALVGHDRVSVLVPLDGDQVQFAGPSTSDRLVPPESADRLIINAPGIVAAPPIQAWPRSVGRPRRWLRTDLEGLVPGVGAALGEHDVRLWGWLASLREAELILWNDPLPADVKPSRPADPAHLTWFYPGEWFGLSQPVPTVQLKWLRRAQQDYEYLHLANQRGETTSTRLLSQLLAKPVQVQPNQQPDPAYGLLTGTPDPAVWPGALQLVARAILLRLPGQLPDLGVQHQLEVETTRWVEPQQRPVLMGRSTQWLLDTLPQSRGKWVDLRAGIDIYSIGADAPTAHSLEWTGVGAGWRARSQAQSVPPLGAYRVQRATMDARVNLDELGPGTREPLEATFTHGFSRRRTTLQLSMPVAVCDRRQEVQTIDGSLGDWREYDVIHNGPLVRMLDRPALQGGPLRRTSNAASLYANWADDGVSLAFRVEGSAAAPNRASRNFVDYDLRRAWGEDACEVLMQPVYADNSTGPVLTITLKPASVWVERKQDARTNLDPWAPLEGSAVRYAATMAPGDVWRGELAVPWKAIGDPAKGRPVLLRFNFAQHRAATAESGSWAGPVDFGRDDAFTGLLQVRDSSAPAGPVR